VVGGLDTQKLDDIDLNIFKSSFSGLDEKTFSFQVFDDEDVSVSLAKYSEETVGKAEFIAICRKAQVLRLNNGNLRRSERFFKGSIQNDIPCRISIDKFYDKLPLSKGSSVWSKMIDELKLSIKLDSVDSCFHVDGEDIGEEFILNTSDGLICVYVIW
jgi:hypothetical protein